MTPGYTWELFASLFPDKNLYDNGCSFPCSYCGGIIVFNEPSLQDVSARVLCPHCGFESEHLTIYQLKLRLNKYLKPKEKANG